MIDEYEIHNVGGSIVRLPRDGYTKIPIPKGAKNISIHHQDGSKDRLYCVVYWTSKTDEKIRDLDKEDEKGDESRQRLSDMLSDLLPYPRNS